MDNTALQKDFYNRFGISGNKIQSAQCGMLYTFLGFADIYGSLSINAVMPPLVKALGRRLDGTDISAVMTTRSEKVFFDMSQISSAVSTKGAQILFDNSIPGFFNASNSVKVCAAKLLMKIDGTDNFNNTAAAAECADDDNISPYIAMFEAKQGYCTKNLRAEFSDMPLPLSGYKLISVYCDAFKNKSLTGNTAIEAAAALRCYLPHISTFSQITVSDAETMRDNTDDIEILNFIRFMAEENKRIARAESGLLKCDIKALFREMNLSCEDMITLLSLSLKQKELYETVSQTDNISAYRFFNGGMLLIVADDMIDYVINEVRRIFFSKNGTQLSFCISGINV